MLEYVLISFKSDFRIQRTCILFLVSFILTGKKYENWAKAQNKEEMKWIALCERIVLGTETFETLNFYDSKNIFKEKIDIVS